jgi:dehydrogenase/reductase SDR family protein 7B
LRSAYCASKHALHGFFDALRAELHNQGIRVTLICPGWVRTEVSLHALRGDGSEHGEIDPPIAKGMDPSVCARHILNAVYKRKAEVYVAGAEKTGVYLKRFAPGLLNWAVRRLRVQ